jgi:hypothetical protein
MIFFGIACLAMAGVASATVVYELNDLNSSATFDPASSEGMNGWLVDGANQLHQQWFWYRDGSGPELSIDTIGVPQVKVNDSNFNPGNDNLNVRYTGQGLRIDVSHTLTGGAAGSGKSDLAEVISITNTTNTVKNFHFFQFVDMDLAGTTDDSTVLLSGNPSPNTATQTQGIYAVGETVLTPRPSRYEAGYAADILAKLQDGSATELANTSSASNGNLAWAFQWDIQLAPNVTYQISKDKNLSVPEPGALVLASLGILLGLGMSRLRKRG